MKRTIIAILLLAGSAQALTLEDYLLQVQKKNHTFQAYEASQSAADSRYEAANLELSPYLYAVGSYVDDGARSFLGAFATSHSENRTYTLGVNKKFSTGTKLDVSTGVTAINYSASTGGAREMHYGNWGVTLSQSLWKDFFGRGTRLRWEREKAQQLKEKSGYNLQLKQSLIQAEAYFWDLVYLQDELEIRKSSLARAQKIEGWVKRRSGNGIGDRADVLNAEALRSARQLQLLTTESNLVAAKKTLADQLELGSAEAAPKLEANLNKDRKPDTFMVGGGGKVMRLDSYLAALDAQAQLVSSQEAAERVTPDLVLEAAYKNNGYDDSVTATDAKAFENSRDQSNPVKSIAVKFNMPLDWRTTGAIKSSANADALAAKYKKERQMLESETAWSELQRRHTELGKQIQAAEATSEIQTARASAQRDKLSKGRAVLLDVVTAEQDAAEAELNLKRMKVEQRKLESQGRLFVKIEEQI